MPRGDGKKPGEPRQNRKSTGDPQYIPQTLARRQDVFDNQKNQGGERRPGSQKGK